MFKNLKIKKFRRTRQKGAAMLVFLVFVLFISLAIISGLASSSLRQFNLVNNLLRSNQSFFLSESGIEDAYFRLKNAQPIDSSEIITLNGNTVNTSITDSAYNEKTITALGDISSRQRVNELTLNPGTGLSFNYGIQAGLGGFVIGNAIVNGNVFSNGTVVGGNGATVTGSAFSAGASGLIDNINIGTGGIGDARANTVRDSDISGNLYCQIGTGNNKSCDTGEDNPDVVDMPVTQAMIDEWKTSAEEGGIILGNVTISAPTALGPKKITGNLAIDADLTITGTIYVLGNITTNNGAHVSLDSSFGSLGGVVITDGRATLSNNVQFYGSGSEGSYVLLISTSICPTGCSGLNAIEILNNVGAVLVNGQYGTVHLNNNVELSEVVGERIIIDNSAEVNYLSGLANVNFYSGPSGGWNVETWKEVE